MRKVERLKKLRQPLPKEHKKIDTSINGDAERLVEEQRIIERQLYSLRIDHRTVIYVSKEKCTPEYAEMKRRKMNPVPEPAVQKGGSTRTRVDVEEVRTLVQSGMFLKDIAKKLGVSKTTIDKYIQKYDLGKNNGNQRKNNRSVTRQEWNSQECVLETSDQYPKKMCFTVFGADKIEKLNIQMDNKLTVSFDVDAKQWQDRWFNSITAWKIERDTGAQNYSSAPTNQNTQSLQYKETPAFSRDQEDDLPF